MNHLLTKISLFLFATILCLFVHGETPSDDDILKSSQNPLASIYGVPETNVLGVNVINGEYHFSVVDFYLPGSDPLVLQRSYSTGSTQRRAFFEGWTHNLCSRIEEFRSGKHKRAISRGSLSGEIPFSVRADPNGSFRNHHCKLNKQVLKKGVTNCGMGEISGRTNLKNSIIDLERSAKFNIRQTNGDGTIHVHYLDVDEDAYKIYSLCSTEKTTGYTADYNTSGYILHGVQQYDWNGKSTQSLTSDYNWKEADEAVRKLQPFHFKFIAEDGRKTTYHFKPYKRNVNGNYSRTICLKRVESTHAPDELYFYTNKEGEIPKKISERRGESHRTQIVYYKKGDTVRLKGENDTIDSKKHVAYERVKQINVAVNDYEKPLRKCSFSYSENKKAKTAFTDVYDHNNFLNRYNYSTNDYRLRTIERFKGNSTYELHRTDRLRWGDEDTSNESNLLTHVIQDGEGRIHFAEQFKYDERGNVIRKKNHFRRATSLQEHRIEWSGKGVMGGEVRTISARFNSLNLPIYEDDGRIVTETSYLKRYHQNLKRDKKSSLVSKRLKKESRGIFRREFFDYDETAGCSLHIEDDGSGESSDDLSSVRFRKITRQQNKRGLFAGLPLEITHSGWDSSSHSEKQIKRIEIDYDSYGHEKTLRHYDCHNAFAYVIEKNCDIQGNVLWETNPLGQVTERVFNKYRCLLREQGPCPDYFMEYSHDLLQRPIRKAMVYRDGLVLSTKTVYDLNDLPIKEIGIYGEVTTKNYNEQKLVQSITIPPIRIAEGLWSTPTLERTYDIFGHLASETDPLGATTLYEHTAEGKILSIVYPDGRQEQFRYTLFGELAEKISSNGSKTCYSYEPQGRIIEERVCDAEGSLLKSHTYTYERSLLVAEKVGDLEIAYTYDYAGRVASKKEGSSYSEYKYDPLGRQIEVKAYFGDKETDYISHQKEYDLLDRISEERQVDSAGNIHTRKRMTYDERGNITSEVTHHHAGVAITTRRYDLRGHLTAETDPLGHTTHFQHRYDYVFEGHLLPCVETTDPTGVKTVSISDYQGRLLSEKKYSPFGELISHTELFYDLAGNCTSTEHRLPTQKIRTAYQYDISNRLIQQVNGEGTPEQIITRFVYNRHGELSETCYADGTSKFTIYDGLGRLKKEWSNDHSIDYEYSYDAQGLPIFVENKISGRTTQRVYSPEGYLLSEKFENGLLIQFSYDRIGRITSCIYPDGSEVRYTYNPLFLSKTERIREGKTVYSSSYEQFDLSGVPKTIRLPKNGGTIDLTYDLLDRPLQVAYPHYVESEIQYDPRGLMSSKVVNRNLHTYAHDDLGQLTREQTEGYTHTYQNDALHRQIAVDGQEQSHNAVHQLIHGKSGDYLYDAKGRRIRDGAIQYIYDRFDRLIQINRSNQTWDYTYDAFHRKMSRSLNGEVCYYSYMGTEEIGSYDSDGKAIDSKILACEEGSLTIAVEIDQKSYSPFISSQGHIVGLVDIESGETVNESPLTMFGRDVNEMPLSPWRFCGKRHESAILGLVDFGFRFYHPQSAQWLTRDPLGESEGPNLYAYVKNNPTRCVDRFGLFMDDFNFSQSWSNFKESTSSFLSHPRVNGSIQAFGGACEMAAGGTTALTAGVTGVGLAVGCATLAHGCDHFITGCRQIYYGEYQDSATTQLLEKTGLSHESASLIDGTMSITSTTACSAAIQRASRGSLLTENNSFVRKNWGSNTNEYSAKATFDNIPASSSYQKELLRTHLRLSEDYGTEKICKLINGRYRYYQPLDLAKTVGAMQGRRVVREWDPVTNRMRTWNETLDHSGKQRIVRPQLHNTEKIHYLFDENGTYQGVR